MEHALFFIRLMVISLWLVAAGLLFSAYQHWPSLSQVGWPTLLFYGVSAAAYLKALTIATKFLWNPK